MHYIYKITNLVTKKSYVGETLDIASRFSEHKKQILTKKYNGKMSHYYVDDLSDASFDDFSFEVLEEFIPNVPDDIHLHEANFIIQENTLYPDGYNCKIFLNGEWVYSKDYTSDFYPDIKGDKNPNYGNRWSDESRFSLSEKVKRNHANGVYEKAKPAMAIATAKRWKEYSDERKDEIMTKQSATSSDYNYVKLDALGNELATYDSIRAVLRAHDGYRRAGLYKAVYGQRDGYKGYKWKRVPKNA